MMNKLKYMIVLVSIIIVIIIILIILNLRTNITERHIGEENILEEPALLELQIETNIHTYLFSQELINTFFEYIEAEEENIDYEDALLSILDIEYIEKNNLTKDNIMQFFLNYKGINSYSIKEIYSQEIGFRQSSNGEYVYTKGIVRKNGEENYIYILIKQDLINNTYSLNIITKEEYDSIKYVKDTKNNISITILKNDYNEIYSKSITEYQICLNFFEDYINTIINNPQYGYKLLDEEYSKRRFGSIDEYKKYIASLEQVTDLVLKEYSVSNKNGYKEYIGRDQKGHYYIFRVSSGMQYTLILDTYTINIPEFLERYEKARPEEKVILNINKFMQAINDENYKYAYSILADGFKEKNFKTIESFEEYVKSNFFENNKFSYEKFGNEANMYYTYDINITDANLEENASDVKKKTFIVLLEEGADFKLSFNI